MVILSLLLFVSSEPPLQTAQIAYMRCLSSESDAALRERVPTDAFASGITQVCDKETGAYRAAVLASGQAGVAAFDEMDAANRAGMIGAYGSKLRSRRGLLRAGAGDGDVAE